MYKVLRTGNTSSLFYNPPPFSVPPPPFLVGGLAGQEPYFPVPVSSWTSAAVCFSPASSLLVPLSACRLSFNSCLFLKIFSFFSVFLLGVACVHRKEQGTFLPSLDNFLSDSIRADTNTQILFASRAVCVISTPYFRSWYFAVISFQKDPPLL